MTVARAQIPKDRKFRTFRAVMALVLREMTTTYGRSAGGYIWAFVQPIAGIALLTFIFTLIARTPPLGTNFPFFYATGLLPLAFFQGINGQLAGSLVFSRALLAYPAVSFTDALMARFLLNGLTQGLVFFLLLTGIVIFYDYHPTLRWKEIFLALGMLVCVTLAFGTMNCYLFNRYPVWQQVWGVMTRPLFLISGIFYLPENLPRDTREIFMWNPMAQVISQFRKGFYSTYDAVYVTPMYPFLLSMVIGSLGLLFLLRNYRSLLLR